MLPRLAGLLIVAFSTVVAASLAGPIPPGRQHRLTIEGENTVTFLPQLNLPELKIDYQAKFEYIVDSRYGKEPKPKSAETKEGETSKDEDDASTEVVAKTASKKAKSKAKKAENPGSRATGAIDVSLHSAERVVRQNGQPIIEMKVSRSRFQGRPKPEMPVFDVTAANAPNAILEIMKGFDVIAASLRLNDDREVLTVSLHPGDGSQKGPILDTLMSLHTPLPRKSDSWESPTQIVMGHGQTAKGTLRFEKQKADAPASSTDKREPAPESTLVRVKVSGVLKAEGVVAGRFVKDGTFTVTGEQTFDMKTYDWINSRWSVVIDNELANPAGQTIARTKGTMTLRSNALDGAGPVAKDPEKSVPKL